MKYTLLLWCTLFFLIPPVIAQRQDSRIALHHQLSPERFAIYLPDQYEPAQRYPLMVAFHPYHRSRWNAQTWADSLQDFANQNQMILLCPDGGFDGRCDDPQDLEMAWALTEWARSSYAVDPDQIFGMGFSLGARACIKFALSNRIQLAGMILIGNPSDNAPLEYRLNLKYAQDLPIYMIHGQWDAPSLRFHPLRESFLSHGACLEWNLLPKTGHTFDFQNRFAVLQGAWNWLQKISCQALFPTTISATKPNRQAISVYPNPSDPNKELRVRGVRPEEIAEIRISRNNGILMKIVRNYSDIRPISGLSTGHYHFQIYLMDGSAVSLNVWVR